MPCVETDQGQVRGGARRGRGQGTGRRDGLFLAIRLEEREVDDVVADGSRIHVRLQGDSSSQGDRVDRGLAARSGQDLDLLGRQAGLELERDGDGPRGLLDQDGHVPPTVHGQDRALPSPHAGGGLVEVELRRPDLGPARQAELELDPCGGHGPPGVVVDHPRLETIGTHRTGRHDQRDPSGRGEVVTGHHHLLGDVGPPSDGDGSWRRELGEHARDAQDTGGDQHFGPDGPAERLHPAGTARDPRDVRVPVPGSKGHQPGEEPHLDQQRHPEAGVEKPTPRGRSTHLRDGSLQAGGSHDGQRDAGEGGEPLHRDGDVRTLAASHQQEPRQAPDPNADRKQVQPLVQDVEPGQLPRRGRVAGPGMQQHGPRGGRRDRRQRPGASPNGKPEDRQPGDHQPDRLPEELPSRCRPKELGEGDADGGSLGHSHRRQPRQREEPGSDHQPRPGHLASKDEERDDSPTHQQGQPRVQAPPAGRPQRRRGRRGRHALGPGGECSPGRRDPDAEAERSRCDVAVHLRHHSPGDGVDTFGQPLQGDTKLEGLTRDRRGLADCLVLPMRVQNPDERQRRIRPFGEGDRDLLRRPVEDGPVRGIGCPHQGMGSRPGGGQHDQRPDKQRDSGAPSHHP